MKLLLASVSAALCVASASIAAETCPLKLSHYSALETGMSVADVEKILGCPGQEMSRSDIAGYVTVMLMWQAPGMASMNAMFQDDALITKAQFGLR